MCSGDVGDELTEEASVSSSELLVGLLLSDSFPEAEDVEDEAEEVWRIIRRVATSGALYDSMFVVEIRLMGPEILLRSITLPMRLRASTLGVGFP